MEGVAGHLPIPATVDIQEVSWGMEHGAERRSCRWHRAHKYKNNFGLDREEKVVRGGGGGGRRRW